MKAPRLWPWFQPPQPAPQQELGLVQYLSPGPRFGPFIGHAHVRQPQPDPGADAYAYEGLGLVEYSPIGPAVRNRGQFNPLSEWGDVWFASGSIKTQGLGGLVRGQFVTQPLLYEPSLQSEDLYAPGGVV